MRWVYSSFIIFFFLGFSPGIYAQGGFVEVFYDDFDGTQLDTTVWSYDIGDGCPDLCGWGNNEKQYYLKNNVTVGNGNLTITAKEEGFGGKSYTSGKIVTRDKKTWVEGKFEARIKLPKGQGMWPAFWLLYQDPTYGIWPSSGEIDIMELLGHEADKVYGTIHYGGDPKGGNFTLPSGEFADGFHNFSIIWDSVRILWYVDDIRYASISKWGIDQGFNWPFDHPFYMILNLAVGGNWPGDPNSSTQFPQTFEIDWVRVSQWVPDTNAVTSLPDLSSTIEGLKVYPNPVNNGKLILESEKLENKPLDITIIDALGKVVLDRSVEDRATKEIELDVSHLSNGVYYLVTQLEGAIGRKTLIISHND